MEKEQSLTLQIEQPFSYLPTCSFLSPNLNQLIPRPILTLNKKAEAKVSKGKNSLGFLEVKTYSVTQILEISNQSDQMNKSKISMTNTMTFLKAFNKKCKETLKFQAQHLFNHLWSSKTLKTLLVIN